MQISDCSINLLCILKTGARKHVKYILNNKAGQSNPEHGSMSYTFLTRKHIRQILNNKSCLTGTIKHVKYTLNKEACYAHLHSNQGILWRTFYTWKLFKIIPTTFHFYVQSSYTSTMSNFPPTSVYLPLHYTSRLPALYTPTVYQCLYPACPSWD